MACCAWALVGACVAVAACQDQREKPVALPPSATAAASADVKADVSTMTFTRVAGAIDVRRGAAPAVWQRIDVPASAEAPEVEVMDLNFDGFADVRVIDVRPAGPNVTYLNWLYEPASGRFVKSDVLDALIAPQFDAARREVRSSWREGATRYGSDTHVFRDGQLAPVTRELKDYKAPGVFTLRVSRWENGAWTLVETREGRDP